MTTPPSLPATTPLSCGGITCDANGLQEFDGSRLMAAVTREEIRSIRFQHGTLAPHPIIQSILGAALSVVGFYPLKHLIHWARHGGTFFEGEAWFVVFLVIGLYLLWTAFRRGYYLLVESTQGKKRFVFRPGTPPAELQAFVAALGEWLGMKIL
jgi:hypothetical protein